MKKTFECGHKGRGTYCHRCAQESLAQQQKKAKRQEKHAAHAEDLVDLRGLPENVVKKARKLLSRVNNKAQLQELGGKKMRFSQKQEVQVFSVPIDRDYRLLCHFKSGTLEPIEVLSHEEYNNGKALQRRYLS